MSKHSKAITKDEDECNIEYLISYPVTKKLCMIHKDIFALTIYIENCLTLTQKQITELNRVLSNCYPSALCVLTKYKDNLFLSLSRRSIIDLDEYMPTITLQGRSWQDQCLQIINLQQNYRWETTHIYNSHM